MAESNGRPLVVYHGGGCTDGFTAAWAAWLVYGDLADYVAASHGEEPPDVRGRKVIILDFSYRREVLRRLVAEASFLVLLDHHQSAEQDLAGFVEECAADGSRGWTPTIVFDMEKSGAMLAWEYFFPRVPPPLLVRIVQSRDLWKFDVPDTRPISAYLRSRPMTFEEWSRQANDIEHCSYEYEAAVGRGRAILDYQAQLVAAICKNAREVEVGGHRVLAANSSVLFSEVAGELAEAGGPFGCAWFVRRDGLVQWSLRARGDFDVSEIAKLYGGGGHRAAAGFQHRPGEGPL